MDLLSANRRIGLLILAVVFSPHATQAQSPAQRLQQAIDLAEASGDCVAAVKAFQEIAKVPDRSLAARALLYAGRCDERLGRAEAVEVSQSLIDRFPEQRGYADEARARLVRLTGRAPASGGLPALLVTGLIDVPMQPHCLTLASGSRELYVTHNMGQSVTVIDTATNTISRSIELAAHCGMMRASADGERIYLSCTEPGLRIIDTATKSIREIAIGGPASAVALHPDGKSAYIATGEGGLRKLDLATGAVSVITGKGWAAGVAISPDGHEVWVSYQRGEPGGRPGHDPIAVFDTATGRRLQLIQGIPNVGGEIVITPDGSRVWEHACDACTRPSYDHLGCPVGAVGLIHIIDAVTAKPLAPMQSTGVLSGATFLFGGKFAVMGVGERMLVVETRTRAAIAAAATLTSNCIAIAPDGLHAYVPNWRQKLVAVVELFVRAYVHVVTPATSLHANPEATVRVGFFGDPIFDLGLVDLNSFRLAGAAPVRDAQGHPIVSIGRPSPEDTFPQVLFNVRVRDLKLNPADREVEFEARTKTGFPIRGSLAAKGLIR